MNQNMLKYVIILSCVVSLASPAMALLYSAKEVLEIRQNMFDVANDLHIKFWQKEDEIEVLSWDVGITTGGLGAPDRVARGARPAPFIPSDNGMHAVDLDWDNIVPGIPQFTTVSVEFTWWLTSENKKYVQFKWTKNGQTFPPKAVGNNGWDVDNPIPIDGGLWRHPVHICNYEDPNDPNAKDIILRNIKFSSVYHYDPLDANDLLNWSSWTDAPVSTIVLHPFECIDFDVNTAFGPGGHILLSYEIVDSIEGMGLAESQIETREIGDHPTGEPECFPQCRTAEYTQWLDVNEPLCWCSPYLRQCHGDADNNKEYIAKKGYYYVHFKDLSVLLAAWNVMEPPQGPGIKWPDPNICADFNRGAPEYISKKGYYRVHFKDLGILLANWNVREPPDGPGIAPNCLDCP